MESSGSCIWSRRSAATYVSKRGTVLLSDDGIATEYDKSFSRHVAVAHLIISRHQFAVSRYRQLSQPYSRQVASNKWLSLPVRAAILPEPLTFSDSIDLA